MLKQKQFFLTFIYLCRPLSLFLFISVFISIFVTPVDKPGGTKHRLPRQKDALGVVHMSYTLCTLGVCRIHNGSRPVRIMMATVNSSKPGSNYSFCNI